MTLKASGNARLVSYPVTLISKGSYRTEWLVQVGQGNVEDDSFDWNSIKPLNVVCRPHHGIAAPMLTSGFTGKAFCHYWALNS